MKIGFKNRLIWHIRTTMWAPLLKTRSKISSTGPWHASVTLNSSKTVTTPFSMTTPQSWTFPIQRVSHWMPTWRRRHIRSARITSLASFSITTFNGSPAWSYSWPTTSSSWARNGCRIWSATRIIPMRETIQASFLLWAYLPIRSFSPSWCTPTSKSMGWA